MSILILALTHAGVFAFGVLFGRRNTKKVQNALDKVSPVVDKVEAEVKSLTTKK